FEVSVGGVLSFLLAGLDLLAVLLMLKTAVPNELWQGPNRSLLFAAIALILDCAVFLFFRLGMRLWLFWEQLRRKQLVWALTYAHVLVVLLLTVFLLVVLEILIIARLSDVFLVVSTTLGLMAVSLIALMVIIPTSALFSYLVMRRTTRRIKTLAAATTT